MSPTASSPKKKKIIDRQVSRLFDGSAAFKELSPEMQRDIQSTTIEIVETLAGRGASEADFPDFVANLIEGTFRAIVDSTIEQMRAYAEMVKSATESIKEFEDKSAAPRPAHDRQQLLASMVLMGINRIVVTDGKISAKIRFTLADEPIYSRRIKACRSCPHLSHSADPGVDQPLKKSGTTAGALCSITGEMVAVAAWLGFERCPDPDPEAPSQSRWGELRAEK